MAHQSGLFLKRAGEEYFFLDFFELIRHGLPPRGGGVHRNGDRQESIHIKSEL
jgi:hypothetical protein